MIPEAGDSHVTLACVSFDPDALRTLGGQGRRDRRPATLPFLLRLGTAAGLAAAGCNLALLLIAGWQDWDTTPPGGSPVQFLAVVAVSLLVGVLGALGAYATARVTKRPAWWVVIAGGVLLVASIQGLPSTLQVMHAVTAVWIVGWLARGVAGGSHVTSRTGL